MDVFWFRFRSAASATVRAASRPSTYTGRPIMEAGATHLPPGGDREDRTTRQKLRPTDGACLVPWIYTPHTRGHCGLPGNNIADGRAHTRSHHTTPARAQPHPPAHTHRPTHTHPHTRPHTHTHTYTHPYTYTCTYTYTDTYTHTYAYTYREFLNSGIKVRLAFFRKVPMCVEL